MKDKGFSLIELVVVLILIGLTTVLVYPSFSRVSQAVAIKAAAQKISGILRYCRSEAVHRGEVYQVLFDTELREVRIQTVAEEQAEEKNLAERKVIKKYRLPEGLELKELNIPSGQHPAEIPAIEFYPRGGSNGGSVILEGRSQKGFKIKIHFLTGIVEVDEG